jgi:hypothetical protein
VVCEVEEDAMTGKIFVVVCLLGLLVSPNMAWSAGMSREDCLKNANAQLGKPGLPRSVLRAAVDRCMRRGPEAILNENYGQDKNQQNTGQKSFY